jgi:hypothetical protein
VWIWRMGVSRMVIRFVFLLSIWIRPGADKRFSCKFGIAFPQIRIRTGYLKSIFLDLSNRIGYYDPVIWTGQMQWTVYTSTWLQLVWIIYHDGLNHHSLYADWMCHGLHLNTSQFCMNRIWTAWKIVSGAHPAVPQRFRSAYDLFWKPHTSKKSI